MSDVKHARDAEAFLKDAKDAEGGSVEPIELALVHANLAMARAAREIDTTIRIGFRDLAEGVKGAAPVELVHLELPDGSPVWFNARELVSIEPDPDDLEGRTVLSVRGVLRVVKGNVVDVSATIFQVVGSW